LYQLLKHQPQSYLPHRNPVLAYKASDLEEVP